MPSKFFLLSVWSPKGFPFRCVHLMRVYFYFPRIYENFLLSLFLFGVSEGLSSEGFSPLHVGFSRKFSLSLWLFPRIFSSRYVCSVSLKDFLPFMLVFHETFIFRYVFLPKGFCFPFR